VDCNHFCLFFHPNAYPKLPKNYMSYFMCLLLVNMPFRSEDTDWESVQFVLENNRWLNLVPLPPLPLLASGSKISLIAWGIHNAWFKQFSHHGIYDVAVIFARKYFSKLFSAYGLDSKFNVKRILAQSCNILQTAFLYEIV